MPDEQMPTSTTGQKSGKDSRKKESVLESPIARRALLTGATAPAAAAGINTFSRRQFLASSGLAAAAVPTIAESDIGTVHVVEAQQTGHGVYPEYFGAIGDGLADDTTPLADWLSSGESLDIGNGVYRTTSALSATDTLLSIVGAGVGHIRTGVYRGAVIEASDDFVTDLLTVASSEPTTTLVEGLSLRDFKLVHRGAGTGLTVDGIYRNSLTRVHVDCDNQGEVGIDLKNFAFFSVLDQVTVLRFNHIGICISGQGSEHILRDSHVSANNQKAVAAVEIQTMNFFIEGGQYNVNRVDNTGIGILLNNVSPHGNICSGRIRNTLCERNVAVMITGDTKRFDSIVIETPTWNLAMISKGVIFDKTASSILWYPLVDNEKGGGTLAEFTENSFRCGIVCGYNAACAPLIVDPGANSPWMRVIEKIPYGFRANITTDPNLTVTCEDVEYLGECIHNGVAWDKHWFFIADDDYVEITPPSSGGIVQVIARNVIDAHCQIPFKTAGATRKLVAGTKVDTKIVALNGVTGRDGFLTVSATGGKIYVENRTGESDNFIVIFKQRF